MKFLFFNCHAIFICIVFLTGNKLVTNSWKLKNKMSYFLTDMKFVSWHMWRDIFILTV